MCLRRYLIANLARECKQRLDGSNVSSQGISWRVAYKSRFFLFENQANMKLQFAFFASALADQIAYNRLLNNIYNHRKYNDGYNGQTSYLRQIVDFWCCKTPERILNLKGGAELQCSQYRSVVMDMPFSACSDNWIKININQMDQSPAFFTHHNFQVSIFSKYKFPRTFLSNLPN